MCFDQSVNIYFVHQDTRMKLTTDLAPADYNNKSHKLIGFYHFLYSYILIL